MPDCDTNATVKERRVEADGLPLRYLVAGEGPPLVLVHGAGDNSLDWRSVHVPGLAEAAMPLWKTPLGAYQRAWVRTMLLFARPGRVPRGWLVEQCRLSRPPGYLEAHVTALRALVRPWGQREVLVDRLPCWRCRGSSCGGRATGCSPSARGGERPPDCGVVPASSSRTPATYPTSRARHRSWQPWKGFSPDASRRSRHG